MIAAAHAAQRLARMKASNPSGLLTCDNLPGLVYASDMKINYGARAPISDANPTGSRVSSTGLVLSWDGHSLRSGKAKNFADPSGNTDGTLSGGVTAGGAVGLRGAATGFDGVDDKAAGAVAISDFSGVTLSAWIKPDASPPNNVTGIWLFRLSTTDTLYIDITTDGRARLVSYDNASTFHQCQSAAGAVSLGSWHHIVGVLTSSMMRVYCDGALLAELAVSWTYTSITSFELGHGAIGYAKAAVEAEGVWNRALTQIEIRQLYEDTYGWVENKANPHCRDISDAYPLGSDRVAATGCVLALDMETLTADGKLRDFSGAGNHATITGAKYQRGSIKNGAYAFAANEYVRVPSVIGQTSFTILMWVKGAAQASRVFSEASTLSNNALFTLGPGTDTSKLRVEIRDDTNAYLFAKESAITVFDGRVHFICLTKNANAMQLYIDGVADPTVTGDKTAGTLTVDRAAIGGVLRAAFSLGFTGTIGPPSMWTVAKSAAEIANLYLDGQKMLGLVQGGVSDINVPGQVGSAVDLNGTSQYVDVPACPAIDLANLSLGCWFNPDVPSGAAIQQIVSRYGGAGAGNATYFMQLNTAGKVGFGAYNGSSGKTIVDPSARAASKWALAVGTISGTNYALYLDGASVVTANDGVVPQASGYPLRMGALPNNGTQLFDGKVAFPFILNRAATAAELAMIHRIGRMARW